MKRASPFALAVLLALAACGGGSANNELAAIDNELIANSVDPALTMALQDQLSVDPTLAQQSNPNSARPPETPVQAQYPADANPGEDESRTLPGDARDGEAAGARPVLVPARHRLGRVVGMEAAAVAGALGAGARIDEVVALGHPADRRRQVDLEVDALGADGQLAVLGLAGRHRIGRIRAPVGIAGAAAGQRKGRSGGEQDQAGHGDSSGVAPDPSLAARARQPQPPPPGVTGRGPAAPLTAAQ